MKFITFVFLGLFLTAAAHASNIDPAVLSTANPAPKASLPTDPVVTGTQTIAATGGCSRVDINVSGQVTGVTDTGGGLDRIRISVWDDGVEKAFTILTVQVGQTTPFNVTLTFQGQYATGNPGVGVYIYNGSATTGTLLFRADPFIPEDVAGSCTGQPPAATFVPATSPFSLALLFGLFGLALAFHLRTLRR